MCQDSSVQGYLEVCQDSRVQVCLAECQDCRVQVCLAECQDCRVLGCKCVKIVGYRGAWQYVKMQITGDAYSSMSR